MFDNAGHVVRTLAVATSGGWDPCTSYAAVVSRDASEGIAGGAAVSFLSLSGDPVVRRKAIDVLRQACEELSVVPAMVTAPATREAGKCVPVWSARPLRDMASYTLQATNPILRMLLGEIRQHHTHYADGGWTLALLAVELLDAHRRAIASRLGLKMPRRMTCLPPTQRCRAVHFDPQHGAVTARGTSLLSESIRVLLAWVDDFAAMCLSPSTDGSHFDCACSTPWLGARSTLDDDGLSTSAVHRRRLVRGLVEGGAIDAEEAAHLARLAQICAWHGRCHSMARGTARGGGPPSAPPCEPHVVIAPSAGHQSISARDVSTAGDFVLSPLLSSGIVSGLLFDIVPPVDSRPGKGEIADDDGDCPGDAEDESACGLFAQCLPDRVLSTEAWLLREISASVNDAPRSEGWPCAHTVAIFSFNLVASDIEREVGFAMQRLARRDSRTAVHATAATVGSPWCRAFCAVVAQRHGVSAVLCQKLVDPRCRWFFRRSGVKVVYERLSIRYIGPVSRVTRARVVHSLEGLLLDDGFLDMIKQQRQQQDEEEENHDGQVHDGHLSPPSLPPSSVLHAHLGTAKRLRLVRLGGSEKVWSWLEGPAAGRHSSTDAMSGSADVTVVLTPAFTHQGTIALASWRTLLHAVNVPPPAASSRRVALGHGVLECTVERYLWHRWLIDAKSDEVSPEALEVVRGALRRVASRAIAVGGGVVPCDAAACPGGGGGSDEATPYERLQRWVDVRCGPFHLAGAAAWTAATQRVATCAALSHDTPSDAMGAPRREGRASYPCPCTWGTPAEARRRHSDDDAADMAFIFAAPVFAAIRRAISWSVTSATQIGRVDFHGAAGAAESVVTTVNMQ